MDNTTLTIFYLFVPTFSAFFQFSPKVFQLRLLTVLHLKCMCTCTKLQVLSVNCANIPHEFPQEVYLAFSCLKYLSLPICKWLNKIKIMIPVLESLSLISTWFFSLHQGSEAWKFFISCVTYSFSRSSIQGPKWCFYDDLYTWYELLVLILLILSMQMILLSLLRSIDIL